jgi:hypothetical protein
MPRRKQSANTLGWKISAIAGPVLAALFVVSVYWRGGYQPRVMLLSGLIGLTIGAIQGPAFSPESFRFPALWQGGLGATGAIAVTTLIGLTPEAIVLWGLAGFFLALLGIHLLRVVDVL